MLEARLEGFERFSEWERSNPLSPNPQAAISGIGLLYDLLPLDARERPIDTTGVGEMHRCLSVLRPET